MTLRESLAARPKPAVALQEVATPEWTPICTSVWMPKVTARRMNDWYRDRTDAVGPALYVAMFAADAAGNRLFNDDDAGWLGEESFGLIDRLFAAGMEQNQNTPAAQAVLAKNSTSGTDAGALPSS